MAGEFAYPKRPDHFDRKFMKLLDERLAANAIGAAECWLLGVIVRREDSVGYRPVDFWNGQLMALAGANSEDTLKRLRRKCVEAGWLAYIPGRRGVAPIYWVTVPDSVRNGGANLHPISPPDSAPLLTTESPLNRPSIATTSLPVPSPEEEGAAPPDSLEKKKTPKKNGKPGPESVPVPAHLDTPDFRVAWADWIADRAAKQEGHRESSGTQLQGAFAAQARACHRVHSCIDSWWMDWVIP